MKRLLIGTTNPAKLEEAKTVLNGNGFEILGLKEFPHIEKIEESGETFEENAILKAKGYFAQTGIPTIADDGGLMVDALDGLPGVHSNRFLGYAASDEELVQGILKRLEGVPREKRTARLGGVIIFWDGAQLLRAENYIEGYIAEKPLDEIRPGFPYRPILFLPQFGKPYSALTHEEHEQADFRRKSLRELKPKILELLDSLPAS